MEVLRSAPPAAGARGRPGDTSAPSRPEDPAKRTERPFASENRRCLHCGLALPHAVQTGFCCSGCETVYGLILAEGLARYYELRPAAVPPPARLGRTDHSWTQSVIGQNPAAPVRLQLDVQGVHCSACVWLLQELFARQKGSRSIRINSPLGRAEVCWEPREGELESFLREAERFGYRFGPALESNPPGSRNLLLRLGLCIAAAMNVMIFSVCFYFGLGAGDGRIYSVIGTANLALATAVVAIGGPVFFRPALLGLGRRWLHLDLPIACGILLSYLGSAFAHFRYGPEAAYFDTVAIFVTLMLLGRWLQEQILERNRRTLLRASGAEHLRVRVLHEDGIELVPASAVLASQQLMIAPGDLVPVEARLASSGAVLSLEWVLGESDPREVVAGDEVPAGAVNSGPSPIRVIATQDFADSRLQRMLAEPPAELDPTAPGQDRFWRRISIGYVLSVLALAALGFLLWFGKDPRKAIEVTIALLVVTCPCAIGLAVPLAREMTCAALRRRGVFLRRSGFLERARAIRKILFDKTGTLTSGRLQLDEAGLRTLEGLSGEDQAVLRAMTACSSHPVAAALHRALRAMGSAAPLAELAVASDTVEEHPGQGLLWRRESHVYRLGRAGFADPAAHQNASVCFSRDGCALASFDLAEELPRGTREEIEKLEHAGFEIHLLSGDRAERAAEAGRRLGLSPDRIAAGLTPEEKAARVRELDEHDTLMVGDGLNDTLGLESAMAAATPAVHHGAISARSDFYYHGDGIAAVRWALTAAVRLHQVVRANLWLALIYNGLVIGLCLAGRVHPVTAAILMPISSSGFVLGTAFRLSERRFGWTS